MTPERAARLSRLYADLAAEWDAEAAALRPTPPPPPTPPPAAPVTAAAIVAAAGVPAGTTLTSAPGGTVSGAHRGVRFTGPVEVVGQATFADCEIPALTCHPGSAVTATACTVGWLAVIGSARFTGVRLLGQGGPNGDVWRVTDTGRSGACTVTDSVFRTHPTQTTNHADVLQIRGCGTVAIRRCVLELAHPGLTGPQYPRNSVAFVEADPSIPVGTVTAEDVWLLGGGSWKALSLATAGVQTTWLRLRVGDWWRTRGTAWMHTERPDGTPRPDTSTWRWVAADAPDADRGPIS